MSDLAARKAAARTAALARRRAAHATAGPDATAHLRAVLAAHHGTPLAGYAAMRSEIDPGPALAEAARTGPVGLPVVIGPDRPLRFRLWQPGVALVAGAFGAQVPETGDWMTPAILVVPLLAFDRTGARLGYGGGFYDRTIATLHRRGPLLTIGFAYAAQEDPGLPTEATDAPLDLVVTERGVIDLR